MGECFIQNKNKNLYVKYLSFVCYLFCIVSFSFLFCLPKGICVVCDFFLSIKLLNSMSTWFTSAVSGFFLPLLQIVVFIVHHDIVVVLMHFHYFHLRIVLYSIEKSFIENQSAFIPFEREIGENEWIHRHTLIKPCSRRVKSIMQYNLKRSLPSKLM